MTKHKHHDLILQYAKELAEGRVEHWLVEIEGLDHWNAVPIPFWDTDLEYRMTMLPSHPDYKPDIRVGDRYKDRTDRTVRIICTDIVSAAPIKVVGVRRDGNGLDELASYTVAGQYLELGQPSRFDLDLSTLERK